MALRLYCPIRSFMFTDIPDSTISGVWGRQFTTLAKDINSGSLFSLPTGTIILLTRSTVPTGWLEIEEGTIGNLTSGATLYASPSAQTLYVYLWDTCSDTVCPVTGGRGSTAIADFNAGKALLLPLLNGRILGTAGSGTGLTSRTSGTVTGTETHFLTAAESSYISHIHKEAAPLHTHSSSVATSDHYESTSTAGVDGGVYVHVTQPSSVEDPYTGDGVGSGYTKLLSDVAGQTSNTNSTSQAVDAHNNMMPTVFLKAAIKI